MLPCSNFDSSSPVFGERKRLTVFVAKDSAIFITTWLTTNNNKFTTFWLFLKYIISCEIKARKQYPLITKRSVNSFRSHIKNSCVVFDRGLQTPRNNKSTRPTASCFHLFLGVWKPRSNTRTRVRYITSSSLSCPYFQVVKENMHVSRNLNASTSSTILPPVRACPGVEPGTSRTLSENHATRPRGQTRLRGSSCHATFLVDEMVSMVIPRLIID